MADSDKHWLQVRMIYLSAVNFGYWGGRSRIGNDVGHASVGTRRRGQRRCSSAQLSNWPTQASFYTIGNRLKRSAKGMTAVLGIQLNRAEALAGAARD